MPYIEDIGTGFFAKLNFPGPLEQEFRKHYSRSGTRSARLMPAFALVMTVAAVVLRVSQDGPLILSVVDLCLFTPLLVATLYLSAKPDKYRVYQVLLALSGLGSGLVVTSMYFRPSIESMPSYFSMEVTWILGVWLILGLRFMPAAVVSCLITVAHIIGLIVIGAEIQTLGYEIVLLFLIMHIGALSCYHIEITSRVAFVEGLEVKALTRELTALAEIDGLTGLNNRRTYDVYIDRLWRQCQRENTILTILLVDIDYFKPYNDHYGHQSGDNTLVAVSEVIAAHARRPLDFAARYGGEEFVLALYWTPDEPDSVPAVDRARGYAEKLGEAIAALNIPHAASTVSDHLTVSIGVAVIMPNTKRSLAGAVQMSDEALYQAKEEGRNRVVVVQAGDEDFSTGSFRTGAFRANKTTAA